MIGLRNRGTINGATSLIVPGDPRSATAITTRESVIMNISAEALEAIMEEQDELRISMMKILSDRLFDSYSRLNVITKVEQRTDYFTIFQEDLRLNVRNLRRVQPGDFTQFWDGDDEYGTFLDKPPNDGIDRKLTRYKRAQV
eukprot:SAG31_NODE_3132_length_4639_cov_3.668502_4_plen_142_part_00